MAHQPAPTTTPTVPVPSQDEIDAALRTLLRVWAPNSIFPDDPPMEADDDPEEYYDPDDGCQCAGTDDDGEPLGCNCAAGCTCDSCGYHEYARAKTCQAGPPCTGMESACRKPTRYRAVGFRLISDWVSSPPGIACGHGPADECPCDDDFAYVNRGARPRTHQTLTACSPQHAAVLIDRMRQVYNEPDDKPARLRWYIEPWTYEPHDFDLPAPLPSLRAAVASARTCTGMAVTAHGGGGDTELWLRYARGDLARALWHASRSLERPDEDDHVDDQPAAPPQEEPSDPWAGDDEVSGGDQ